MELDNLELDNIDLGILSFLTLILAGGSIISEILGFRYISLGFLINLIMIVIITAFIIIFQLFIRKEVENGA